MVSRKKGRIASPGAAAIKDVALFFDPSWKLACCPRRLVAPADGGGIAESRKSACYGSCAGAVTHSEAVSQEEEVFHNPGRKGDSQRFSACLASRPCLPIKTTFANPKALSCKSQRSCRALAWQSSLARQRQTKTLPVMSGAEPTTSGMFQGHGGSGGSPFSGPRHLPSGDSGDPISAFLCRCAHVCSPL